ncbi:Uncharacterized conserved protein YodC, DUF2158 family [Meinhardsimonia xiamenensis]|jgi:uncharacterized protein YodC (DUF2158 family)|uniref:Uncharacterized conserved protein YodC, DUF2158 family n=1 Tax=Meinhardsimonia xiamenensis TaxID=990712 RepID=A0A1G9FC31_9RHOB|nr:DUF2158 domain-containing protein [Meinhardsimonia xiamenensis]PRX37907.1 uncharacterized protein YodC (DUF2158 family) [Meinhardsimonia xiamenensis]SDK85888.1 Uncharacterized conserved protein YodC, DUF2158 family [Meinhardsimonia xiamenensis]
MTEKFKQGDLVELKSGGPTMTYGGEAMYGDAICYWFEGTKRQCASFPHSVLKRVEGE